MYFRRLLYSAERTLLTPSTFELVVIRPDAADIISGLGYDQRSSCGRTPTDFSNIPTFHLVFKEEQVIFDLGGSGKTEYPN